MINQKEKIFYDSPPEKKWCFTGEALFIKNTEHRKILNVRPSAWLQPFFKWDSNDISYIKTESKRIYLLMYHNFKILSN
jgi:hypothetical protein